MVKKLFITGIIFLSFWFIPSFAGSSNSPIVQIVSYKNTFWKYFELMWWGSASVINKDGYIVTNNHVVDDGKWGVLDFFNICISQNEKEKPKCYYTANLVARDTQKDIALLKINNTDIYWSKVDIENLQNIVPDYEYSPKSGDQVEAIGYPWVWSETITKTQWIISGTSEYNGATYLKTDTLIAWGNSGGALIKDGKLIWIPTFWIGWWSDTSLWYALLLSDAKSFIESNLASKISTKDSSLFNTYKKEIEELNSKKKVKDNLLELNFWEKYEVASYIKDKTLVLKPSNGNAEIPQNITIGIVDLPTITKQDDFFYYLQKLWLYYKDSQKLKKVSLWWIDFYSPVSLYDSSNGDADISRTLFGHIWGKAIIIYWEFWNIQEDTLKKVQTEFDKVMQSIPFNKTWIQATKFEFSLKSPEIIIKSEESYVLNESSGIAIIFPYKNLHEYITFQMSALDTYSGKWKTISSLFESETKDITSDMKSLISFRWYQGYLYCSENSLEYENIYTDEKGNELNQTSCKIKIYWLKWENDDFVLDITEVVDKKNKVWGLKFILDSLSSIVEIPSIGSKETNLVNIYTSQKKISFTDIKNQPEWYKNKLKLLTKYNIIQDEGKLDPYTPIKWGEFINMYASNVYKLNLDTSLCSKNDYKCRLKSYKLTINGKKASIAFFLDQIGIRLNDYVNSDKLSYLPDTLDLIILWEVNPQNLTEEIVSNYYYLKKEKDYEEINKKIEDAYFRIYGNKKIGLYDINYNSEYANFVPAKWLYFTSASGWIIEEKYYQDWKLDFSKIQKPIDLSKLKFYYPVATKASMIDFITEYIDFWLFDKELAKKKDTNIEE